MQVTHSPKKGAIHLGLTSSINYAKKIPKEIMQINRSIIPQQENLCQGITSINGAAGHASLAVQHMVLETLIRANHQEFIIIMTLVAVI